MRPADQSDSGTEESDSRQSLALTVVCRQQPFSEGDSSARATSRPAIPGYEVLAEAGRGGEGLVYKARQLSAGRLVALKVMRDGTCAGPEQLARFRGGAEWMAGLHHPHIARVYEVGDRGGWPFLAMEFVEGGSLVEEIAGRPQPARWAARVVEGLARGAHCAHRHGVVHLDLKPANVLLTGGGVPKVSDFGLARRPGAGGAPAEAGRISGTPSYMAPEQAHGDAAAIGPTTDVYGLGAVLYELLTGRRPFRGESVLDTLRRVVSEEPEPPRPYASRRAPRAGGDLLEVFTQPPGQPLCQCRSSWPTA